MAFGTPAPGAMNYSSAVPVAQQLAQASQAAPQANADAKEKLAGTQAQTQVDQAAGTAAQLGQQNSSDAMLARLASVPGIDTSPMGIKMLTDRFKTLGIPLPKNETGQIDMAAVRAIAAPPVTPWAQMTAKDKADFWAQNPKDRTIAPGAPDDAATRPAVTPLTEKGVESLMSPVTKAEAALAAGKGNTQSLLLSAQQARAALAAKGGDTSAIDAILTPDGKSLKPEYMVQKASDLAQAQIDNLHSLGIYRFDEEKVKQQSVDNQMTRWNTQSANNRATTSVQEAKMQQQAAQFTQKMSVANQNLAMRAQSIGNQQTTNLLKMGAMGVNAYNQQVGHLEKAQGDAEKQLASTQSAINNMMFTPGFDATNPAFVSLTSKAKELSTTVDTGRTALETARSLSANGISGIYGQITGNTGLQPIININTAPGTTYPGGKASQGGTPQYKKGSAVPDAPGYKFNGVTRPNGDLEAVGPDGKIRPWNSGA